MNKETKKNNMTDGVIWKSIILFALPIMGGLFLQMLYSTVDGIVVGNFLGEGALGAVNTSGAFVNVLLAVSNGISGGSGVYLAQLYGANEKEKLHKAMATMLILMIACGSILLILGELFTGGILHIILNVPDSLHSMAAQYLRVYLIGLPLMFVYNGLASSLRSIGDSAAAMLMLVVSSVINIALDIMFVAIFGWGVMGVAIATVIAQATAVISCIFYVRIKQPLLHVPIREWTFEKDAFQIYLMTGIPLAIQYVISQLGAVGVQRLVNSYGKSFMASCAAAGKIEQYAIVPIMSFAQTMVVFSGQNVGAQKTDRAKKGLYTAWCMSTIGCIVLAFILIFGAKPLVMLFGCRGETLDIGIEYLHFIPFVLIFAVFQFTTRCLLQGAGDVTFPMVVTFITLGLRVASAYAMAATPIGYRAVWVCTAVDFSIGALMNIIRFVRGSWEKKSLVK